MLTALTYSVMLVDVTAVNIRTADDHRTANPASPRHRTTPPDSARRRVDRRSGRIAGDQRRDDHRQRRAPDAEFGARGVHPWSAVDRRRLQPGVRSTGAGRRNARRQVRPAGNADRRSVAPCAEQRRSGAVHHHRFAHCGPAGDGSGRGADLPDHAGDHHRYLPGPEAARRRHRAVGGGHRSRRRDRADPRRCAVGGLLVGQPVPRAGAHRPGRRRGGSAGHSILIG